MCRQRGLQADVFAEHPPEQAAEIDDDLVEVEETRLEELSPAEREKLACDRSRTFGGATDFLHVGMRGMVVRKNVQRELGITRNRSERVVQIVRDPAGEAADRVQFLSVTEPLLQLAAAGNVLNGANYTNGVAISVADNISPLMHPAHPAVAGHDPVLDVIRLFASNCGFRLGPDRDAIIRMHELKKRLCRAFELAEGYTEDPVRLGRPAQ